MKKVWRRRWGGKRAQSNISARYGVSDTAALYCLPIVELQEAPNREGPWPFPSPWAGRRQRPRAGKNMLHPNVADFLQPLSKEGLLGSKSNIGTTMSCRVFLDQLAGESREKTTNSRGGHWGAERSPRCATMNMQLLCIAFGNRTWVCIAIKNSNWCQPCPCLFTQGQEGGNVRYIYIYWNPGSIWSA